MWTLPLSTMLLLSRLCGSIETSSVLDPIVPIIGNEIYFQNGFVVRMHFIDRSEINSPIFIFLYLYVEIFLYSNLKLNKGYHDLELLPEYMNKHNPYCFLFHIPSNSYPIFLISFIDSPVSHSLTPSLFSQSHDWIVSLLAYLFQSPIARLLVQQCC
jgi:hypothetical protein